ncbi:MAG: ABC transporter permease subunit [Clostridiales bacterium]|nr:ABC transporter permease subunit [Clostridiales bacterium]
MKPVRLVFGVFLSAALPRIFSGIKVGWARAWRGLISAEMIFGGGGALGIGYYINDRRTQTDIAGVFATIIVIVIVIIGTIVEYGLFRTIENKTLKKWGMTR